ncbi:MAG: pentapeptide repeat-containing protein [Thalassovita sp.]
MAKRSNGASTGLLKWLGIAEAPNWRVARPLGPLVAVVLALLFVGALTSAAVVLLRTIGNSSQISLGVGALITALLGAPFLIWGTLIKQKTPEFQKEGHITDRISKAVEQLGTEKTVKTLSGSGEMIEQTQRNIEVRIGGLLSLERIAQDSVSYDKGRDHVRVMEIICAYIRENAPARSAVAIPAEVWAPSADEAPDQETDDWAENRQKELRKSIGEWVATLRPAKEDIQTALNILARRSAAQRQVEAIWLCDVDPQTSRVFDEEDCPVFIAPDDPQAMSAAIEKYSADLNDWQTRIGAYAGYRLDLRHTNLQMADLSDGNFTGANFIGSQIQRADLTNAQMQRADLSHAQMQGAHLLVAQMQEADLSKAQIQGAHLSYAQINENTSFNSATLESALLREVDLTNVNLSKAQIKSTFGDASVILPGREGPASAAWPEHWPKWELPSRGNHSFDDEANTWRADPENYVPPPPPSE